MTVEDYVFDLWIRLSSMREEEISGLSYHSSGKWEG